MSESPIDWSEQQHGATKLLVTPLTFRLTPVSQIAVFSLFICATPLAWSSAWLLPTYLLPILLSVWIVRNRTVIGDEHIVARTMLGKTRFTWDELRSLRLDERRWVRAVLESGREVPLPAVRVRDVPVLAQVSGGRLADPTTVESIEEAEEVDAVPGGEEQPAAEEHSASQDGPAAEESPGTEPEDAEPKAVSEAGTDVEREPGDTAGDESDPRTRTSERAFDG